MAAKMFYDEDFRSIAVEFPNFSYNVVAHDKYLMRRSAPEDVAYYTRGLPMMITP